LNSPGDCPHLALFDLLVIRIEDCDKSGNVRAQQFDGGGDLTVLLKASPADLASSVVQPSF
jgi:hypothetical protein